LFQRERTIDTQLDVTRSWDDTGEAIESIEPIAISTRDNILIQQNSSLEPSDSVMKIWVKDIQLDFTANEYSLQMIERTTPCGEDLQLLVGYYYILTTSSALGLDRDQWIFLTRKN
jgi:hypothetical protein